MNQSMWKDELMNELMNNLMNECILKGRQMLGLSRVSGSTKAINLG